MWSKATVEQIDQDGVRDLVCFSEYHFFSALRRITPELNKGSLFARIHRNEGGVYLWILEDPKDEYQVIVPSGSLRLTPTEDLCIIAHLLALARMIARGATPWSKEPLPEGELRDVCAIQYLSLRELASAKVRQLKGI